ncbi:hypothetical protein B0H14DRAFT_2647824 [Mycena olivaceomarginata]|nr:hypothetical protein B0H14DRAFT_2647824 [Mycena olivaceomarginata]
MFSTRHLLFPELASATQNRLNGVGSHYRSISPWKRVENSSASGYRLRAVSGCADLTLLCINDDIEEGEVEGTDGVLGSGLRNVVPEDVSGEETRELGPEVVPDKRIVGHLRIELVINIWRVQRNVRPLHQLQLSNKSFHPREVNVSDPRAEQHNPGTINNPLLGEAEKSLMRPAGSDIEDLRRVRGGYTKCGTHTSLRRTALQIKSGT